LPILVRKVAVGAISDTAIPKLRFHEFFFTQTLSLHKPSFLSMKSVIYVP